MKILIADDSRGNRHEPNAILQVLLDYLASGVTLFGPDLEMIACNSKLRELLDFPVVVQSEARTVTTNHRTNRTFEHART